MAFKLHNGVLPGIYAPARSIPSNSAIVAITDHLLPPRNVRTTRTLQYSFIGRYAPNDRATPTPVRLAGGGERGVGGRRNIATIYFYYLISSYMLIYFYIVEMTKKMFIISV